MRGTSVATLVELTPDNEAVLDTEFTPSLDETKIDGILVDNEKDIDARIYCVTLANLSCAVPGVAGCGCCNGPSQGCFNRM